MHVNVTFEIGYYNFLFSDKIFLVFKFNWVLQGGRKMGKRKKRKIFLILNWNKKVLLSLHIFFYQTEGMCFIPKTDNDAIHLSKDVLGMLQVGFWNTSYNDLMLLPRAFHTWKCPSLVPNCIKFLCLTHEERKLWCGKRKVIFPLNTAALIHSDCGTPELPVFSGSHGKKWN